MHLAYARHGPVFNLLFTPRPIYPAGIPVELTLLKTNMSPRSLAYTYPDSRRYDFAVYSGDMEIWRWSYDKLFIQVVETVPLSPGQTISYREYWPQTNNLDQQVPPGLYSIRAWNPFEGYQALEWPEIQVQIR